MDVSVNEWVLGGHSLGGIAASAFFQNQNTLPTGFASGSTSGSSIIRVTRLVQWATPGQAADFRRRRSKDCSSIGSGVLDLQSALRINGTRDGVVASIDNGVLLLCGPRNSSNFQRKDDCIEFETEMIVGGNHSGFGNYGQHLFPMDWELKGVTLSEQQAKVVKWTTDFILGNNRK